MCVCEQPEHCALVESVWGVWNEIISKFSSDPNHAVSLLIPAVGGWLCERGGCLGFLGFNLKSALDCYRAIGTGSHWNNYREMIEAASSLTAGINDHLPLGKNRHKSLERADASFSGRISSLTPNFPLCAGNMEAFEFQIQAEDEELLETNLAFAGRHSSVM